MIMKSHMASITEWLDDSTCVNEVQIRSANIIVDTMIYNVRWIDDKDDFQVEHVGEVQIEEE